MPKPIPTERRNLPPKPPDWWRRGDPITATKLNQPVDAIRQLRGAVAPPRQVFDDVAAALASPVYQYKVVSTHGDYLIAEAHTGVPTAETDSPRTRIAVPYLLRRTPFDGLSRNAISYTYTSDTERTATDADDDTESQQITPDYVAGDIIYAVRAPQGGTGVTITNAAGDTVALEWLDLNADGRAWAQVT